MRLMRFGNVLVAGMVLFATGCSFFNSYEQAVSISCTPADLTLRVNGKIHPCQTQVLLPKDEVAVIVGEKPGYVMETVKIRPTISGVGVTDAIAGMFLLVPAVGLLSPGAYELMMTDVHVRLDKAR